MQPVNPDIGYPEVTYAEEQPEYMPIRVAVETISPYCFNLISRWQPTPDERARIAAGGDIFVAQLHFTPSMTPLRVGLEDEFRKTFEYTAEQQFYEEVAEHLEGDEP